MEKIEIGVIKIFRVYNDIKSDILTKSQSNLRGHLLKLEKNEVQNFIGKYSYSNKVANECIVLNEETIKSNSFSAFKRKPYCHLCYNR